MKLPAAIEKLVAELSRFPGVGRRSAERMAFDLLAAGGDRSEALESAVGALRQSVGVCDQCGYFTENGQCLVCGPDRDPEKLLVVERAMDVVAFEKAGGFRGRYHVLGGHLSALKGITPDKLRLAQLFQRVRTEPINELILALSPSVEGDATAFYIAREVESPELTITRLGRGVPMGGTLEFADAGTLRLALEGRQGLHR